MRPRRLSRQLASFPRRHWRLCVALSHASAGPGALCADCAERQPLSGARRCERRYAGAASVPASYRDHTLCRIRDLRDPRPASEPVCVWKGTLRSVCISPKERRHRHSTCSINIFTALQWGRRGVGARTVGRPCGCCHRQLSSLRPRPLLLRHHL